MVQAATIENKRWTQLQSERKADGEIGGRNEAASLKVEKLTFWQKVSKHWLLVVAAVIFDIFGLIPILSIVVNFIFGLIIFLYFANRKGAGSLSSGLMKVFFPISLASILDAFFSLLPVNTCAALSHIYINEE